MHVTKNAKMFYSYLLIGKYKLTQFDVIIKTSSDVVLKLTVNSQY